mgnify:CR=1 FL=1
MKEFNKQSRTDRGDGITGAEKKHADNLREDAFPPSGLGIKWPSIRPPIHPIEKATKCMEPAYDPDKLKKVFLDVVSSSGPSIDWPKNDQNQGPKQDQSLSHTKTPSLDKR